MHVTPAARTRRESPFRWMLRLMDERTWIVEMRWTAETVEVSARAG